MSQNLLTLDAFQKQYQKDKSVKYVFFWGHSNSSKNAVSKACFSQWYFSPFSIDGVDYATAEHYMMACKAKLFNDEDSFEKILKATTPTQAKAFGRQVKNFQDSLWDAHCSEIVRTGNFAKFSQHKALGDFLLATGDRVLVEASPVDRIWGIGLAEDAENITNPLTWKGKNLLGFALMAVRERLKQR